MSDNPTPDPKPAEAEEPKFTQADVDAAVKKIAAKIRSEERQKVTAEFADYDDLKVKAGQSTTLEERVAGLEQAAKDAESRAIRAEIANAKGLTPSQAKRLVGSTREELEADADELLADIGAQKETGNVVPREGNNPQAGADESREFVRGLFSRANID
jgi:hypothetical protein